jgi:hypothetical protein
MIAILAKVSAGQHVDHLQSIRAHARNNNASLRTVAEAIVEVGLQV